MIGMRTADLTVRRARWLAELAGALEQARSAVHRLAIEESGMDAGDLFARIEDASLEVERLRLRRSPDATQDLSPEWSKDIPWQLSA